MKKHVEIAVDEILWTKNSVKFHFTFRSHKGDKFGLPNCENGNTVVFDKVALVGIEGGYNGVYRHKYRGGVIPDFDIAIYTFSSSHIVSITEFAMILQAIAKYNAYEFPDEKHKIVIDGKEIKISDESFKALKESLTK